MKHPTHICLHTFMKAFQALMMFITNIHSSENSLTSRVFNLGIYPQNDDCLKIHLVQVHISNSC